MDLVIRLTKDSRNLLLIPPASLTDSGHKSCTHKYGFALKINEAAMPR